MNDGIVLYIILTTGIIMALGMIFYKKNTVQVVEEDQFQNALTFYGLFLILLTIFISGKHQLMKKTTYGACYPISFLINLII